MLRSIPQLFMCLALAIPVYARPAKARSKSKAKPKQKVIAVSPCPVLSGTYHIQSEDGDISIRIEQKKCDEIFLDEQRRYSTRETVEKMSLKLNGSSQDVKGHMGAPQTSKVSAHYDPKKLYLKFVWPDGRITQETFYLDSDKNLRILEDPPLRGTPPDAAGLLAQREL